MSTKTMLLEEVLPYLRKGRRARNGGCEYRVENRELQLMTVSGDWTSSMDPLLDGWVLVPEQFDFLEAFRRMQAGKKVRRALWFPACREGANDVEILLNGKVMVSAIENILATDWEEVE